ncbi:PREDICTED: uncharacterized protein K02A2.6-like [Priapulus caudatus]|uniref:RNA-directed DNA polymerase n=1 Tax=Priapulus caudatus TaxID=37621 RepID=A0ABM1FBC7_PRICU|nr:PREDICTED: uncharacterized protein K02A2.6-like [Priapulus caudatus]
MPTFSCTFLVEAVLETLLLHPGYTPTSQQTQKEVVNVHNITCHPLKDERLLQISGATLSDDTLVALGQVIMKGWPSEVRDLTESLRSYFSYSDELAVQGGIILRGGRIVVPVSLRKEVKENVHQGHLGINSCLRRARDLIFWPGMSAEIRQYVEACGTCATYSVKQRAESPVITEVPQRPWQKVASDLLSWAGCDYLVTVDYHSNFFKVDRLRETTAEAVIMKPKGHFSRYGIPDTVVTDNADQFTSARFRSFARGWKFHHELISPGNSQANGAAEAAVKIAKRLMRKGKASGEDPFLGLLNARNTPTEGMSTSPAQRLLGRRTKTVMPISEAKLKPGYADLIRKAQSKERKRMLRESRRNCRELSRLAVGNTVRMQPLVPGKREWQEARVSKQLTGRSFEMPTEQGKVFRRNRRHLRKCDMSAHSLPP